MTNSSVRPLRRDAEANLQRVLEATWRVLARQGLEFSMEDVAREAGCGVGTIYRRFESKEALLQHQFDALRTKMAEVVETAIRHEDAVAGLENLLAAMGQAMADNHGLRDLISGVPALRADMLAARRALRPAITGLLERAKAAGSVRADVEESDLSVIVAMLAEVIAITAGVDPQLWRRYLRLLLDGLHPATARPLGVPAPSVRDVTRMVQISKARQRGGGR